MAFFYCARERGRERKKEEEKPTCGFLKRLRTSGRIRRTYLNLGMSACALDDVSNVKYVGPK
jgi:hypothetical protein